MSDFDDFGFPTQEWENIIENAKNERRLSTISENGAILHRRMSTTSEIVSVFQRRISKISETGSILLRRMSTISESGSLLFQRMSRTSQLEPIQRTKSHQNPKLQERISEKMYDEDTILILTKEESQQRINLLLIIISCLLSIVILAYVTHLTIILLVKDPQIVQPILVYATPQSNNI